MKAQWKKLLPIYFIATLVLIAILFFPSLINFFSPNDPSIVWADSFGDGELDGWYMDKSEMNFYIIDGKLMAGPDKGGEISHESLVSSGTWSFDLFFPDDLPYRYKDYRICYICDENISSGIGFQTFSIVDDTQLTLNNISDGLVSRGEYVNIGRRLAGWEHFDITRDEMGKSRIYLNGDLIIQFQDEETISSKWFILQSPAVGPSLDNIVVRNQVIDIKP